MKKLILFVLLALFSLPSLADQYTFGIVPQQSPVKLFKKWQPIIKYLSDETGHQIILKTEKSITDFEEILYQGGYDFSYMNPYHYVVANRTQSYMAEVRAKKDIRGILVSTQNTLDPLVNRKDNNFLFPSPNAFAATLLIKYELLTEFGVNLNELNNYQYVNSHDSVYKGVARNIGNIGGGIQRTFRNFDNESDKNKLNVIYKTKPYPSHPISFQKEMNKEAKAKLISALLNMPDELSKSLNIKKLIKISDDEYDIIRDLEEKLLVVDR